MPQGTLYTLSISNIDDPQIAHVKHKLFIVRSAKNADSLLKRGWVIVPQLSPNEKIFYMYLDLKKKGQWNQNTFDNKYTPAFLFQMQYEPEMRSALNRVRSILQSGEDVAVACYCPDFELCHRSLVASAFAQRGYTVSEL